MVLNLRSSIWGTLDGGVAGGVVLIAAMKMSCLKFGELTALKEMDDCDRSSASLSAISKITKRATSLPKE